MKKALNLFKVRRNTIDFLADDLEYGLNDLGDMTNIELDNLAMTNPEIKQVDMTRVRKMVRYIREVQKITSTANIEEQEIFNEWFTEENKDNFQIAEASRESSTPGTQVPYSTPQSATSTTTQTNHDEKKMVSVKISDYPNFTGKAVDWFRFKEGFEATAEAAGFEDVLEILDHKTHTNQFIHDQDYYEKCKALYAILRKSLAGGMAISKVTKFKSDRDGALAWDALKAYYDQNGNKDVFGQSSLQNLMNLKLEYNSFGGMDKYVNDFELYVTQLVEAEQELTDAQKKTFFLNGIQDRDYSATKDMCDDLDYEGTVLKLRKKALLLHKESGGNPTRPRKQQNFQQEDEGENDQNEGKKGKNSDYLRVPKDVWSKMTQDQRKKWLEIREKMRKGEIPDYGSQYSTDETRNQKMMKSDDDADDNAKEKADDIQKRKANQAGSIWRPVDRRANLHKRTTNENKTKNGDFNKIDDDGQVRRKTTPIKYYDGEYKFRKPWSIFKTWQELDESKAHDENHVESKNNKLTTSDNDKNLRYENKNYGNKKGSNGTIAIWRPVEKRVFMQQNAVQGEQQVPTETAAMTPIDKSNEVKSKDNEAEKLQSTFTNDEGTTDKEGAQATTNQASDDKKKGERHFDSDEKIDKSASPTTKMKNVNAHNDAQEEEEQDSKKNEDKRARNEFKRNKNQDETADCDVGVNLGATILENQETKMKFGNKNGNATKNKQFAKDKMIENHKTSEEAKKTEGVFGDTYFDKNDKVTDKTMENLGLHQLRGVAEI